MERIEMFKKDMEQVRKEFEEFQNNQLKVLEELSKIKDLSELDAEIEAVTYDFDVENENLVKELILINKKMFEEMVDNIWKEAKNGEGAAANV